MLIVFPMAYPPLLQNILHKPFIPCIFQKCQRLLSFSQEPFYTGKIILLKITGGPFFPYKPADLTQFLIVAPAYLLQVRLHIKPVRSQFHHFMYLSQQSGSSYNIVLRFRITFASFIPVLKGVGNIVAVSAYQFSFPVFQKTVRPISVFSDRNKKFLLHFQLLFRSSEFPHNNRSLFRTAQQRAPDPGGPRRRQPVLLQNTKPVIIQFILPLTFLYLLSYVSCKKKQYKKMRGIPL